ncbi:hypothetical protein C6568_15970 [Melaminivora suipulveris]|uniref:Uncharacterized protein n=1 Tax=Melaminivora suipulveris TaxID=2109913 RepID=A0A2R3QFM7_9BURK|nr:type III secretion system translocon subunit SctB [Melaminivora suipulveris]AVO50562.1 hypothetical protein C6568_15970 [Melaminivora suipulveris]
MSTPIGPSGQPVFPSPHGGAGGEGSGEFITPDGQPTIPSRHGGSGGQGGEAITTGGRDGSPAARLQPNRPVLASLGNESASAANAALAASKLLQSEGSSPADRLAEPRAPTQLDAVQASLGRFDDSQVSADIYAFMALFQKMAQEMRNTARTQRTTEFQGQITALQNAAEKMKDAAGQRFAAAITQGITQIVGGLAQAGASAYSAKQTIQGARMEARGSNLLAKAEAGAGSNPSSNVLGVTQRGNNMIAAGKELGASGTKWAGYGQGASGLIGGMGGIIAAGFNNKADLLDADKTNLETQAKMHETAVQHANDMMQQMMDVIRDVRDKLASIQQSQVETTRGIARNI